MGDCGSNLLGLLLGCVAVIGSVKTQAVLALVFGGFLGRGLFGDLGAGALGRSVGLAAAMDSRGYGRTTDIAPATRRAYESARESYRLYCASIGAAIATRAIMADLRAGGDQIGGPAAFTKADKSRFLQALDEALVRLAR